HANRLPETSARADAIGGGLAHVCSGYGGNLAGRPADLSNQLAVAAGHERSISVDHDAVAKRQGGRATDPIVVAARQPLPGQQSLRPGREIDVPYFAVVVVSPPRVPAAIIGERARSDRRVWRGRDCERREIERADVVTVGE